MLAKTKLAKLYKSGLSLDKIAESDPRMIEIFLKFLREIRYSDKKLFSQIQKWIDEYLHSVNIK